MTTLVVSLMTSHGQSLEIPKRPLGFFYGGTAQDPNVEIVAYLDVTCPNSKAVYPTLLQVAEFYASSDVQLRMHLFPLPYHRNSYVISKAAQVLDQKFSNNNTAFQWVSVVFDNIGRLNGHVTVNMNDAQVMSTISSLANQLTGIQEADLKAGVSATDIEIITRLDFKYSCTRGVHGTPMFTVNDIFVDASSWDFNQWKAFLDGLL
ncbi:eppin [Plakobranchus ocellatus]|uniref:Eppin n=1 Tax=Plakobranchus ocellatus TaxID=259542 RepID=A0AAV3ZZ01_9GAST|nr:eppin [Plakobranchus ocellatus]